MKKTVSILTAIALSVMLILPVSAAPFSDTDGHWANNAIEYASAHNLINGDGDGTFRPDDNITRAEFLKVLSVCIDDNIDMSNTEGMSHWVAPYYNYATANYLEIDKETVNSSGSAAIHPGEITDETADMPVARWEMAYMVWQGVNNYLAPTQKLELAFNDNAIIKSSFSENMQDIMANVTHTELGLFKGDENNNFNPSANATRAEAATILCRAYVLFGFLNGKNVDEFNENEIQTSAAAVDYTAQPDKTDNNDEQAKKPETDNSSDAPDDNKDDNKKENNEMAEHSFATVTMENGDTFKIELMPEYAPETVANFISLAESGFYDGLTFHRVVDGFMAQGGDPAGNGTGGSDKKIKGEFAQNGFKQNTLSHTRGVISMARSNNPDSASSQFFICYSDKCTSLDGQYAAFGKVIEGMDTVDSFLKVERTVNSMGEKAVPKTPIVIKSISISK